MTGNPDESELDGLDPYDLQDEEARRLAEFFAGLPEDAWARPSRCEGWSVRDVLAHLAATQSYFHACLDDTLQEFLDRGLEAGATDLTGFNEWGIRSFDDRQPAEILDAWHRDRSEMTRRMRERDGGRMTTMVPDYPVRLQAFHIAIELATHADDVGVPEDPAEAPGRADWQARFDRFALVEAGRDVEVVPDGGRTRVRAGGAEAELSNAEFVDAVAARLPADHPIPAELRAALALAP